MPVVNRTSVMNAADRMILRIRHFARGTYPEADGEPGALPVNRFFLPIRNPNGAACYIEDAFSHETLCPGRAYFIPLFHSARVRLDAELEFLSIQFTLEFCGGMDLFSRLPSLRVLEEESWLRRAEEAYDEREEFVAAALVRGLTEEFAAALMRSMTGEQLALASVVAEFRKELEYLQSHCLATTTVEELAALRGCRREVFSRNFTVAMGIPPKQFLARSLTNRACDLLLRGDRLVREVAFELGFGNEYYFSRFFRKQTGLSPLQFQMHYLSRGRGRVRPGIAAGAEERGGRK